MFFSPGMNGNDQSHRSSASNRGNTLRYPNGNTNIMSHRSTTTSEKNSGGSSNATHRVHFSDNASGDGILRTLWGLVVACVACVCVASTLTILAILYVTVRPFSLAGYRRLAAQLGAASLLDAVAILLPNMRLCLTGDSDVPSPVGTSILVSNHLVDGDWWALYMLGRCVGLRGSLKAFLRNEFLHVNVDEAHGSASNGNGHGGNGSALVKSSSSNMVTFTRQENNHSPTSSHVNVPTRIATSPDLSIAAKFLHKFLEFPLLNDDDNIADRGHLLSLLRSFAASPSAPVHFLCFPEGWCLHSGADRRAVHARSNDFASREGRPQLKHLLLPRTRGFNAKLESLRESSPVIYDVTMVYSGYNGSLPTNNKLSLFFLWSVLRRTFPQEIHFRIKRYSMAEVLQDSSWLDKKWAEKDRMLHHFARHQTFPADHRGYCRHREFDTRHASFEGSLVSLGRLMIVPFMVPFLVLISLPFFWTLLWVWLAHRAYLAVCTETRTSEEGLAGRPSGDAVQTPGSAPHTPFFPATPFVSPSTTNWQDSRRDT